MFKNHQDFVSEKQTDTYPDKQTVLRVWEDGNPYSNAFSFSSLVAVSILTGGDLGLGADTTSYTMTENLVITNKLSSKIRHNQE